MAGHDTGRYGPACCERRSRRYIRRGPNYRFRVGEATNEFEAVASVLGSAAFQAVPAGIPASRVVIGGIVTNGTDYARISRMATIPATSSSAIVTITPIDD